MWKGAPRYVLSSRDPLLSLWASRNCCMNSRLNGRHDGRNFCCSKINCCPHRRSTYRICSNIMHAVSSNVFWKRNYCSIYTREFCPYTYLSRNSHQWCYISKKLLIYTLSWPEAGTSCIE
jgi:hypothetical protein